MSIIGSVLAEITKWLLGKVDERLDRPDTQYRDEAIRLYESLYTLSESVKEYRKRSKLFWVLPDWEGLWQGRSEAQNKAPSELTEDDLPLDVLILHMQHEAVLSALVYEFGHTLAQFRKLRARVVLESKRRKGSWDSLESRLIDLSESVSNVSHRFRSADHSLEDFRDYLRAAEELDKSLSDDGVVDDFIDEFKTYLKEVGISPESGTVG